MPSKKINNFWSRLESLLSSRKLALTLLLLLLLICVVSTLIPQESQLPPETFAAWRAKGGVNALWSGIGLTRVFSTWYFLALILLLFFSTLAAIIRRVRALIFRSQPPVVTENTFSPLRHSVRVAPTISFQRVRGQLRGFRWTEEVGKDGPYLYGVRHFWARWSIVCLHGAFLLLLLGAFVSQADYFRGYLKLGVGQDLPLGEAGCFQTDRGIFSFPLAKGMRITLLGFDNSYRERGYAPDMASDLLLEGGEEGPRRVRLLRGETVRYGGLDIYQSPRTGFGPLIAREEPDGSRDSSYLYLQYPMGNENPKTVADIPATGMQLQAEFLSRSKKYFDIREIVSPQLQVAFVRSGAAIYQGRLKPGESAVVEGSRYTFKKIDYWSDFAVTRDPGIFLVYAGFAAIAFALFFFSFFTTTEVYILNPPESGESLAGARNDRFQGGAERAMEKITEMGRN